MRAAAQAGWHTVQRQEARKDGMAHIPGALDNTGDEERADLRRWACLPDEHERHAQDARNHEGAGSSRASSYSLEERDKALEEKPDRRYWPDSKNLNHTE